MFMLEDRAGILVVSGLLTSGIAFTACATAVDYRPPTVVQEDTGVVVPTDETGATPEVAVASVGVDKFCENYCTRVNSCDSTNDKQTCIAACKNANAASFPKLRSDVVALIDACVTGKDCATVMSSTLLTTCATEAAATVAPSSIAAEFCDTLVAADLKCGRTTDKAACLNSGKLYNDSIVTEAKQCAAKSCTDIQPCVTATLGSLSLTSIASNCPTCDKSYGCKYSGSSSTYYYSSSKVGDKCTILGYTMACGGNLTYTDSTTVLGTWKQASTGVLTLTDEDAGYTYTCTPR